MGLRGRERGEAEAEGSWSRAEQQASRIGKKKNRRNLSKKTKTLLLKELEHRTSRRRGPRRSRPNFLTIWAMIFLWFSSNLTIIYTLFYNFQKFSHIMFFQKKLGVNWPPFLLIGSALETIYTHILNISF